ncbi:hypothetical protein ACM40_00950 [Chryseobacterium sp. BLS98]|uniref:hypothetical protein n=1 Tax=Chryseobacterium sp. BLS98 TaxID=885586 RepID=UPI00065AADD9|nr:hypothetical protein [Chryseobacterium sp. BLS98]KMQ63418.1 hypothetical protein ACM40_00950 [Chryseobacterium sp. BLS98]
MNKKLLFVAFCILNLVMNAQENTHNQENNMAEFHLEDGSSFKANSVEAVTKTVNLGQIIVNNRVSVFQYTTAADEKRKEINSKDVRKIIYYNGNEISQIQEKIKVKTVDKKGNLSNDTAETFEYLLYDGKIKLYSSNVFECMGLNACYYTHSNFYIQKTGEPYTVLAVKQKSQFNSKMGSSIENIVDAFRAVAGDCSPFNQYLNSFDKEMMQEKHLDKTLQKEYQEIYKTTLQEVKKDREQTRKLFYIVGDKIQNRQAEIYIGIIKEYEKNCP